MPGIKSGDCDSLNFSLQFSQSKIHSKVTGYLNENFFDSISTEVLRYLGLVLLLSDICFAIMVS